MINQEKKQKKFKIVIYLKKDGKQYITKDSNLAIILYSLVILLLIIFQITEIQLNYQ